MSATPGPSKGYDLHALATMRAYYEADRAHREADILRAARPAPNPKAARVAEAERDVVATARIFHALGALGDQDEGRIALALKTLLRTVDALIAAEGA